MNEKESSLEAEAKLQNDEFIKNVNKCDNAGNTSFRFSVPSLLKYDKILKKSDYHR